MTQGQLKFLGSILRHVSDYGIGRVCDDVPHELQSILTADERRDMAYLFELWNSKGRQESLGFAPIGLSSWVAFASHYIAGNDVVRV